MKGGRKMNDRIKNKLYKAFNKYNTDCLIGKIRKEDCKERTVIFVRTYDLEHGIEGINIIGLNGINLLYYDNKTIPIG